MINELYQLAHALEQSNVSGTNWHRKYKPIPNVSKKAPCIRIVVAKKHIVRLESVDKDVAARIKKYGSNQGSFPGMNLRPLYRLSDVQKQKQLTTFLNGNLDDFSVKSIRQWCEKNNWNDSKFKSKFKNCILNIPKEISDLFSNTGIDFSPISILVAELVDFCDADLLHAELEKKAFELLENRTDISLALQLLFYPAKEKDKEDGSANISVVFDAEKLIGAHCAVISDQFTNSFNNALVSANNLQTRAKNSSEVDAFGIAFAPLEEPMPSVKLAAGFETTLRTMFKGQPCQSRYGCIENATYPIAPEMRSQLQAALAWIGDRTREWNNWIKTDKNEALFAYPASLPDQKNSGVSLYKKRFVENGAASFEAVSKSFIQEIVAGKELGTDPKAEHIQLFILRKIDKARTKVVYTYNTSPREIEYKAENWSQGRENLPKLPFGEPETAFPLDVADTLNQFWKQDGTIATDKFRPVPAYHGMELFFGQNSLVRPDLTGLVRNLTNLAPHLMTDYFHRESGPLMDYVKNGISLLGLFLNKLDYRKENYMSEFPYLLGQLLKLSDALHAMYCKAVRRGDVPPQLVGSSMYIAASEYPLRTLAQLAQRMHPYLSWANSYRWKGIEIPGQESGIVGWYYSLYEKAATQLRQNMDFQTRFNDEEKAALFIGYLAAFPKKENTNHGGNENE